MYEAPLVEELKRRMLLDGNGAGGLANLPVDSRYRKNFMLVKFLRARDLDLDKAERMMRSRRRQAQRPAQGVHVRG